MRGRRVLFIDDDDDLRDTFADTVRETFEAECLALDSYDGLLAHREEALGAALAILDVNLGADVPSGLDAYRWLRQEGFRGPVIFLTGHASSHPLVAEAHRIGDALVVAKPASMATLGSMMSRSEHP
jgi:FixJ family two-component response regulator